MAFPLKSGVDLYNNQALRLRLHNLGADPTEVGAGLIYFNTSSGLNSSGRVRVYTGSEFKSLAFVDEIANNAEFIALQEKVALLAGDVDTDAIISNMKEVSAFLSGFAEDASLMDYLNTELGKKLNLTGGTITIDNITSLVVKRNSTGGSFICFENTNGTLGFLGVGDDKNPKFADATGVGKVILHEGNFSNYALPLSGGTISGVGADLFRINRTDGNPYIAFSNNGTHLGRIGYTSGGPIVHHGNALYDILHSGNGIISKRIEQDETPTVNTFGLWNNVGAYLSVGYSETFKMEFRGINGGALMRVCQGTNSDTGWKTIAFTDSTVEAAYKLVTSEGTDAVTINSSGKAIVTAFGVGASSWSLSSAGIQGDIDVNSDGVELRSSNGVVLSVGSKGLILNSSGNVLIGTTDDNGAKLQVKGDLHVSGNIIADGEVSAGGVGEEGSAGAGGGSQMYATTIAEGTTTKDIAHGLATDDIVISIYEKDSTSGLWNMVLTDIEITDANNIRVTFGSATTVEHKVVIFGAVA